MKQIWWSYYQLNKFKEKDDILPKFKFDDTQHEYSW